MSTGISARTAGSTLERTTGWVWLLSVPPGNLWTRGCHFMSVNSIGKESRYKRLMLVVRNCRQTLFFRGIIPPNKKQSWVFIHHLCRTILDKKKVPLCLVFFLSIWMSSFFSFWDWFLLLRFQTLMKPILGYFCTLDDLGYDYKQVDVMYMILGSMIGQLKPQQCGEHQLRLLGAFHRTCTGTQFAHSVFVQLFPSWAKVKMVSVTRSHKGSILQLQPSARTLTWRLRWHSWWETFSSRARGGLEMWCPAFTPWLAT